jgi:TrmH family RNA methyltransferase
MSQIDHYFRLIESPQNDRIKQLKIHLEGGSRANKLRIESKEAVIEGIHLLKAWIDHGSIDLLSSIITSSQSLENKEIQTLLQHLVTQIEANDLVFPEMILIDEKVAKSISSLANGPVLIATTRIPEVLLDPSETLDAIVLDAIQDSGNVGTMLRTAAAAGIPRVFCTVGTANIWSNKVLRAAMGAHLHLEIKEGMHPSDFLDPPQAMFVTSLENTSQSIFSLGDQLLKPHTWVFGNEGQGVHPDFFHSGQSVFIPQEPFIESLNVASASAICLFEARRTRITN